MVIGFEFDTGQFGDGRLFQLLLPQHLGLEVVELLENGRRSALFAVVLMVADEEGTCNVPELSIAFAIRPSSASISLTIIPFATPPIDGLQDISPKLFFENVTSAVLAPIRAEAAAASQPACPPPITITSKL